MPTNQPLPTYGKNCTLQDYVTLLEYSYQECIKNDHNSIDSRLDYLGNCIFQFITYDDGLNGLLTTKALEVCDAITRATTFEYISNPENYQWYIVMCNIEFFSKRLNWGTSIRGAWWDHTVTGLYSCEIYIENDQLTEPIKFEHDDWVLFIQALAIFAAKDKDPLSQSTS